MAEKESKPIPVGVKAVCRKKCVWRDRLWQPGEKTEDSLGVLPSGAEVPEHFEIIEGKANQAKPCTIAAPKKVVEESPADNSANTNQRELAKKLCQKANVEFTDKMTMEEIRTKLAAKGVRIN